jgi:hypothetical protein
MDIGKLNQSSLGNLHFDGWQLVEEKLVEYAVDSYDKTCSHFDGADGATAYTDHIAGAFTFNGTAQLDTAQKKFGSASLLLDGDSDYVTLPDSASWDFGSGSFTTDCWIRFASLAGIETIWSQADFGTNYYNGLRYDNSSHTLIFMANNLGTFRITCHCSFTPVVNTWYHIALVRSGNTWYMFIDGVSKALTLDAGSYSCTLDNFAQLFQIGRFGYWESYFNGWIDEFRVSKGIARWTSNFTPPTEAYITNSYTFSGLNGDVDEEYRLVSRLVNKYDGACGCYLRPNNDSTAANYGGQNISGISTAAAAVRSTAAEFYLGGGAAALNRISMSDIILQAKSGLVRTSIEKFAYDISTTTVTGVVLIGRSWNNVVDNITSLVLATSQPGAIGVGTHLLLFKRTLSGEAATVGVKTGKLNIKTNINAGIMQLTKEIDIPTLDAYTKLMIHGDAIADATGKTITNSGTTLSTTQYKFPECGSAISFSGSGQYLSLSDSADWNFGSGDFTIDTWIRFTSLQNGSYFYYQYADSNNRICSWFNLNGELRFYAVDSSTARADYTWNNTGITTNTWHHIAIVRNGTSLKAYLNGIELTDVTVTTVISSNTFGDIGAALYVASNGTGITGYINEYRISKGLAKWTSNFTPPIFSDYGGARTQIVLTDLNGNIDTLYELIVRTVSAQASMQDYFIFNTDIGANYGRQSLYGINTTASANRSTIEDKIYLGDSAFTNSGQLGYSKCLMYVKSGNIRVALVESCAGIGTTTVTGVSLCGHSWNNASDNITIIPIRSSVTGGFGAGTHVELWILKKKL